MANRFSYMIFACALGILIGCYNPKRDLSIDPHNTPLIHILDAAYEANTGIVVVEWEYLGQKRVENFVLQRRDNISGFRNVERSTGADAQGRYATEGAFHDRELFAGERMQYRVVAEHSEGGLVSTSAVEVLIPGAGLREVRRDPIALAVQLVWQAEVGEVVTYEIVRAPVGGDYETVFVAQDPQQTSFSDRSIADNRSYTYAIRSHLSTGVQLTSRNASVQFYREAGRYVVEALSGASERMRLSAFNGDFADEADMVALIARPNQLSFFFLRHIPNVEIPHTLLHHLVFTYSWESNNMVPQSMDMAGHPLTGPAFSSTYIGGIDSARRVFYTTIANTNAWQIRETWMSESSQVRFAQDDQQRVYIATGGQLRVYSPPSSPVGAFDFPNSDPVDIAVHNGVIWAAWANGIQRGVLHFSGEMLSDIAWDDMLHPQIEPRALTLNTTGQVFVLDRTQVRVFRANGEELLSWALPSGAFSAGDLTIGGSSLNLLHLSDGNGEVITYVP